ncbi:helix-turn-helix transcriptional regulator [Candidatus Daviesbacteria bacterium]|nr:helix-turn-helix transcriptional regulator [Candidatus Daviesbacteria bacterium]
MANINEALGKRIRAVRRAKKMTQEDLAYESKIDYSYLNEIEAGKRNPSIKRINAIAKALKIPVKELFD